MPSLTFTTHFSKDIFFCESQIEKPNLNSILKKRQWKEKGKFVVLWTRACKKTLSSCTVLVACVWHSTSKGLPILCNIFPTTFIQPFPICQNISAFKPSLPECYCTVSQIGHQGLGLSHQPLPWATVSEVQWVCSGKGPEAWKSLLMSVPNCLRCRLCVLLLCSVLCIRQKAIILTEMYLEPRLHVNYRERWQISWPGYGQMANFTVCHVLIEKKNKYKWSHPNC